MRIKVSTMAVVLVVSLVIVASGPAVAKFQTNTIDSFEDNDLTEWSHSSSFSVTSGEASDGTYKLVTADDYMNRGDGTDLTKEGENILFDLNWTGGYSSKSLYFGYGWNSSNPDGSGNTIYFVYLTNQNASHLEMRLYTRVGDLTSGSSSLKTKTGIPKSSISNNNAYHTVNISWQSDGSHTVKYINSSDSVIAQMDWAGDNVRDSGGISIRASGSNAGNFYVDYIRNKTKLPGTAADTLDATVQSQDSVTVDKGSNFEVNATVTFINGTTKEVSEDSSTTYTFSNSMFTQNSPKDNFTADATGTSDIKVEYTGPEGQTVTDNVTITVENPVQSIDTTVRSSDPVTINTVSSFEVNVTATFADGSTQEVSTDSGTSYTFDSNAVNQLSPKDQYEPLSIGTTDIQAEYSDGLGNTVSDNVTLDIQSPIDKINVSVKGETSLVEINDTNTFEVNATIHYNNGTVREESTSGDISYSFDSSIISQGSPKDKFSAAGIGTSTLTGDYTDSLGGTTSDSVDVKILRDFNTWSLLSPIGKTWLMFQDWGFLAIFASALGGVVTSLGTRDISMGAVAFNVLIVLSWMTGFISIVIPAGLIIFEAFVFLTYQTTSPT